MILSIVVPVYNEEVVLAEFHQRLSTVLANMELDSEIIYVNDGSTDNSLGLLHKIRNEYPNVAVVDLSRNFGKEVAMTAGLDHATGDAVVIIDADLQDPPELIPEFVKYWREGYDVVYGQRSARDGESLLKISSAHAFYRIMNYLTRVNIPVDSGDFRLFSRRAVDAIGTIKETHRYMKGLFAWIGFRQKAVAYKRDPRFAGETKWNYWALWNFAVEGITSFSAAPLKLATYMGILTASVSFIYGIVIITKTILFGEPVQGYPSLMVVILFLGGIQLLAIGLLGEYLGRTFYEAKNRPLYFVNSFERSHTSDPDDSITNATRESAWPATQVGSENTQECSK